MSYKLELYVELDNVFPIGLSIAQDRPDNNEIIGHLNTAIRWLTIERQIHERAHKQDLQTSGAN